MAVLATGEQETLKQRAAEQQGVKECYRSLAALTAEIYTCEQKGWGDWLVRRQEEPDPFN